MIEFWVVEVGGDAKVAEVSTHRVKLALQPRLAGGGKVWVPGVTPASSAAPSGSPARSTIRASRSVRWRPCSGPWSRPARTGPRTWPARPSGWHEPPNAPFDQATAYLDIVGAMTAWATSRHVSTDDPLWARAHRLLGVLLAGPSWKEALGSLARLQPSALEAVEEALGQVTSA